MLKKIVIVGPESSGKSTLCSQLASHYNTLWCPEFAREYLLKHGTSYSFDDLLIIANGQLTLEDVYVERVVGSSEKQVGQNVNIESTNKPIIAAPPSLLTTPHLLFLDTDMYVMKVWCEFVFGQCHRFILNQIVERKYDLYLLCKPDLPWVKDELREYPDLESRERLYHIYKELLVNQYTPWVEISGGYNDRLAAAINAVETLQ